MVQAEAMEANNSKLTQRIQAVQEQGQLVREEVESLRRNVLAQDAGNRVLQEEASQLRERMLVSAAGSLPTALCLSLQTCCGPTESSGRGCCRA